MDNADAYRRCYERIRKLVSDDNPDANVPACPGWTVKDVVAHLAGFFTAYQIGTQDAFGPGWAEREIEARRDRSLEQCMTEWSELLAEPGNLFESNLGPVAVSDVLAHEQDIRAALSRPGARDDENIVPAVDMALAFVAKKTAEQGLPALRVITEDVDRQLGDGESAATLRTSTFELFRTLHGRRTPEQVRAMKWDGDPAPWMPVLFLFGPTDQQVELATERNYG